MKPDLARLTHLIHDKKWSEALRLIPSVLQSCPDDPVVYLAWSICEAETGSEAKACEVLEAALEKFPDDSSILYALAETLKQLNRLDEAENRYRLSIRHTPANRHKDKSEAWNSLGVMLWDQLRKRRRWMRGAKPYAKIRRTAWPLPI